ncbi:DNA repair helicase XPB1 [Tripterygium wilfordii]|uniref:DNA repair helicase XPB1 n=1 Tax=Tripterygium wilfordii TaxID=458696 RepID=A0A7J7CL64_TRIWF|nr:DNA repair helicase XPB1 [Tripterygium wilfordii]
MIFREVVEDEDVYFGEEAEDGFRDGKLCYELRKFLRDIVISRARSASEVYPLVKAAGKIGTSDELLNEAGLAAEAEEKETHSFEIGPSQKIFKLYHAI